MEIITYNPKFRSDFRDLNIEWVEKFFVVEPMDEQVLGNPEKYILDPGGMIFFAHSDGEILGTVALMKMEGNIFELTKMAVTAKAQGKGIAQRLMEYAIDHALDQNWSELIIYTNSSLKSALYIYMKFGFKKVPIEQEVPYERADVKMRLVLP